MDGSPVNTKPRLTPVLMADLVYLAQHMRPDEKDQFCAVTNLAEYDADYAARVFSGIGGISFALVGSNGYPLCAGGFFEASIPGTWQSWMAGTTEAWRDHWKQITREAKRLGDGLLHSGQAHRIQTYALAERVLAHRWYQALGQVYEGTHRRFFADGRDAVCYAKTRRIG